MSPVDGVETNGIAKPRGSIDPTKITAGVRMILEGIGEDPDREGLRDTADRVARMYAEVFQGLHQDPRDYHHIQSPDTDAVLLTGGTGLSSRDGTYEVVQSCLDKELTGFGELFRMFSYEEIGAAAMMSRATAGVAGQTVIVSMPGSSAAVRLALEKLILPELAHMTYTVQG